MELHQQATTGQIDAKQLSCCEQELVLTHVPYVHRLARRFYRQYRSCGIDFDDCISAGYVGLCRPAQRYDQTLGHDFKTFSFLRIRGAMFDLLREHGMVSRGVYKQIQQNRRAQAATDGEDALDVQKTIRTETEVALSHKKLPYSVAQTSGQLRQLS